MTLTRRTPMTRKPKAKPGTRPKKARQDRAEWRPNGPSHAPKKALKRKASPHATKEEKAHVARVAEMDCKACIKDGVPPAPTCIHHIRSGYGTAQRASNYEVLPLCEGHHQGLLDATKLAFHQAPRTWQLRYGTEIELLQEVYADLKIPFKRLPELVGEAPPWWGRYLRGGYASSIPDEARAILVGEAL